MKNDFKIVMASALALCLASCASPDESNAKELIASRMKDPDSVQFRNIRAVSTGIVCGEYNAKNGFGGYAGFSRFVVYQGKPLYAEQSSGLTPEQLQASERLAKRFGSYTFDAAWAKFCS